MPASLRGTPTPSARRTSRFGALVHACHKRKRPIIMTAVASGAGMTSLALGWEANRSFRSPMAIHWLRR